jgi:hypothetical protein
MGIELLLEETSRGCTSSIDSTHCITEAALFSAINVVDNINEKVLESLHGEINIINNSCSLPRCKGDYFSYVAWHRLQDYRVICSVMYSVYVVTSHKCVCVDLSLYKPSANIFLLALPSHNEHTLRS